MAQRRRAQAEFEATPDKLGTQAVTLAGVIGGYNGYSNPELLSPQFWAAASQVYAGLFGAIRRARFATLLNSSNFANPTNSRITSMFSFFPPGAPQPYIIFDNADTFFLSPGIWKYGLSGTSSTFGCALLLFFGGTPTNIVGPYMRVVNTSLILQSNGLVRSKIFYATPNTFNLEFWGLDAADASPQITIAAAPAAATIAAAPTGAARNSNIATITTTANHGFTTGQFVTIAGVTDTTFNSLAGATQQITVTGLTTFTYPNIGTNGATSGSGTATVQITKTVGRSYQYAWENANTGHVSAPSPASQFVKYNNQIGTIDCIEPGTVSTSASSPTVTGVNTQFSQAWVGRLLWVAGGGGIGSVIAVASATSLTLSGNAGVNLAGAQFQICDFQSTHIRLYETGDGGSVYFRTARNQFFNGNTTLISAGLEFSDTSNSEPPNAPFTSEITQSFNVPPPIGQFLSDYQGRPIVFGVAGALQSFFYGNIETTVVGQPPESFAPLNQVTLPVGDGQINGWANLPTGSLIWSNRQDMFKLTGLLTDNTVSNQFQLGATIQRLPYRLGCGSAYATAVTNLGAFWLTEGRQVQLFTDHYAPKNVGLPIQDILNRINGRINFARMKNYKRGDRNWLALAISLDSSTFNNKLCLLDLDLLASNGQPSFFTFDMATNQPTWYLFDINCESIESAIDSISQHQLLCGDVDLITDADYHANDFAISENSVSGGTVTLHALGNEAPEVTKELEWLRANTNQLPNAIAGQGWSFGVLKYDDEQWVIGAANSGNLVSLVPGVQSSSVVIGLENSPADFRFDAAKFAKGRRFQFQINFPSTVGNWEFRGFQVRYTVLYER